MLGNRFRTRTGVRLAAVLSLAAAVLAACQTGPVYRPRGPGEAVGYADRQLAENRFRVTFAGGASTRRDQVEDYLLQRSAEVTLDAGYTHFIFDARDTEAETYYRTTMRAGIGYGFGGLRPWYWSSFAFNDPWFGDVIPMTRYEAYAEIVTLTPEEATRYPDALDARDVLYRLAQPVG